MNQPQFHPIRHRSGIFGAVASRIGGRAENQDSFMVSDTPLGLLVAVCDGMGGGPAGKTASLYAAEAIVNTLLQAESDMNPADVLRAAVEKANSVVVGATVEHPELRGMGTTCVALLITGDKGYIAHVGDSRCYQIRNHEAVFRTADHSYVGELVRRGKLSEEEARTSNYSNVITRAIGGAATVEPDISVLSIAPHDRFALMSDGIWGVLPEPNLVNALSADGSIEKIVDDIVATVDVIGHNHGGGHDNLTLAVVEVPEEGTAVYSAEESMTYSIEDDADSKKTTATEVVEGAAERVRNATLALEEDSAVIEEDDKSDRKWRPLFWCAIGLCVVLAGITVWSLFLRGNEAPPQAKAVVADSLKINPLDSANAAKVLNPNPDAAAPAPIPEESKNAATDKLREMTGYSPDYSNTYSDPDPAPSSPVDDEPAVPEPPVSGAVADLNAAKTKLESLKNSYSNMLSKENNSDEFRKRFKERTQLKDEIVSLIGKAQNRTDNVSQSKSIEDIKKKVMNMKIQIDPNNGQPTDDCVKQVDRYSKELSTLINSL